MQSLKVSLPLKPETKLRLFLAQTWRTISCRAFGNSTKSMQSIRHMERVFNVRAEDAHLECNHHALPAMMVHRASIFVWEHSKVTGKNTQSTSHPQNS